MLWLELCLCAVLCLCSSALATEVHAASIDIQSENGLITLNVTDAPRGDVIAHLAADASIEWRDPSLREQLISGTYRGALGDILGEVLDRTDFIVSYEPSEDDQRIRRLLVIGRAHAEMLGAVQRASDPTVTQTERLRERRLRRLRAQDGPIKRGKNLRPTTAQVHQDAEP
jgi:hypothetical protein